MSVRPWTSEDWDASIILPICESTDADLHFCGDLATHVFTVVVDRRAPAREFLCEEHASHVARNMKGMVVSDAA